MYKEKEKIGAMLESSLTTVWFKQDPPVVHCNVAPTSM